MKKIAILATPRTGSSLLMHSLALHPQAICAGEYFNFRQESNHPAFYKNKTTRQAECNLFVIQPWDLKNEGLNTVLENSYRIRLYRQDREAQLADWKKCCETGIWMPGQTKGNPVEFPKNANEMIDEANDAYKDRSNLELSYEQLQSAWDETINTIEGHAGWNTVPLKMAIQPIGA